MYQMLIRLFALMIRLLQTVFKSRQTLVLENLALRQQLANYKAKNRRPVIHDFDRSLWIAFKCLWSGWKDALVIVKPATVIDWQKRHFKRYWTKISSQNKTPGRNKTTGQIRKLICQMAAHNAWGAPRILSELLMLGFEVSQSTVSRYLKKFNADNPDVKERSQSWKTFLNNCRQGITAMDFLTVPTIGFKMIYVFFIIDHDRRRLIHCNVTAHPTAQWVKQQLREAFSFDRIPKYLIFDRDSIFSSRVKRCIKNLGIKPKQTSFRSPWQNGVAERWVRSVRTELLDPVLVFNENQLRQLLKEYVSYYNNDRCHLALGRDAPNHRPASHGSSLDDKIAALPRLNGLVHKYEWRRAA